MYLGVPLICSSNNSSIIYPRSTSPFSARPRIRTFQSSSAQLDARRDRLVDDSSENETRFDRYDMSFAQRWLRPEVRRRRSRLLVIRRRVNGSRRVPRERRACRSIDRSTRSFNSFVRRGRIRRGIDSEKEGFLVSFSRSSFSPRDASVAVTRGMNDMT